MTIYTLTKKWYKKLFYLLDKRERFIIQTIFLTAELLVTQFIWEDYRFFMVIVLALCSYGLSAWSLTEDITGWEWIYLFILPVLFTSSLSLFYFLLPGRWISRLTIMLIFVLGTYAVLRVENIYNVAVQRSIQLVRVARTVGLLLTLLVVFLSSSLVFSLRLYFWQNAVLVMLVSFLLALQSCWSITLEKNASSSLLLYSLLVSLIVGELAIALSFWPVTSSTYALMISAGYYTSVGLIQHKLQERLFSDIIREYSLVFFFTSFLILLTTKWG